MLFAYCNAIIITHRSTHETPRIVDNVIISKTAVTYTYNTYTTRRCYLFVIESRGTAMGRVGCVCILYTACTHIYYYTRLNTTCGAAGTCTRIQCRYIYLKSEGWGGGWERETDWIRVILLSLSGRIQITLYRYTSARSTRMCLDKTFLFS